MPAFNVDINVNSDGANKRLEELERNAKAASKPLNIDVRVPTLDEAINGFRALGQAIQISYQVARQLPVIGMRIQDIEMTADSAARSVNLLGVGLQKTAFYANPLNGIKDSFTGAANACSGLIDNTARLGYVLFGVTQSLSVLNVGFKQLFDETIGREIQLRDTILRTATSVAGTTDIIQNGLKVKDPTKQLEILEGPINETIDSIRTKSLEIAGTTSEAVIQVFGVVAQNISAVGGDLKKAEDLAVKFSGALGTLGMSDPMYARQEVSSILMGNIDMNSVLAKTLNISSADVQRAKTEAGGLYGYLSERLEVFSAGQKKASLGFKGITSNLQELREELSRSFGSTMLDPILKRLNSIYEPLSKLSVIQQLKQTGAAGGAVVGSTVNTAVGYVAGSAGFTKYNSTNIENVAKSIEKTFARVAIYIQTELEQIGPTLQKIFESLQKSVYVLGKALFEIATILVQIKIDRLEIAISSFKLLAKAIEGVVAAYAYYLKGVEQILSSPLGRYLNDLSAQWQVLEKVGVLAVVRTIFILQTVPATLRFVSSVITTVAEKVRDVVGNVVSSLAESIETIGTSIASVAGRALGFLILGLKALAAAISEIALTLRAVLIELAAIAQRTPALAGLALPLLKIADGFKVISVKAKDSQRTMQEFGDMAKLKLEEVKLAARGAAEATRNVGATIQGGLVGGARQAGSMIGNLGVAIGSNIASMFLWQLRITLVLDLLRRLGEWWDNRNNKAAAKQALDALNNGLNEQAIAAAKAGKSLDAATESLLKYNQAALQKRQTDLKKELEDKTAEYNKFRLEADRATAAEAKAEAARAKRRASGPKLDQRANRPKGLTEAGDYTKAAEKAKKELDALLNEQANIDKILNAPKKATDFREEFQLRKRENEQLTRDLAKFELDARKQLEDKLFQYRQQNSQQSIEIYRASEEIRLFNIDKANKALIKGQEAVNVSAMEAINQYILNKKRGELDIEAKKRELAIAATSLDKEVVDYRLNVENKIAELKKKVGEWEGRMAEYKLKKAYEEGQARAKGLSGPPEAGGNNSDTYYQEGVGFFSRKSGKMVDGAYSVPALRNAIIGQESGGSYTVENPDSKAIGIGQVMPANVPSWTAKYYGKSLKPQEYRMNNDAQDKVVNGHLAFLLGQQLAAGFKGEMAIRRVAMIWYGGPDAVNSYDNKNTNYYKGKPYPSNSEYTKAIYSRYTNAGGTLGSGKAAPASGGSADMDKGLPELILPSVETQTAGLAGAVNRVKELSQSLAVLQAQLTKARSKDEFSKISDSLFPQNDLNQYKEQMIGLSEEANQIRKSNTDLLDMEKIEREYDTLVKINMRKLDFFLLQSMQFEKLTNAAKTELAANATKSFANQLENDTLEKRLKLMVNAQTKLNSYNEEAKKSHNLVQRELKDLELRDKLESAGVHPAKIAGTLAKAQAEREYNNILKEANKAIAEQLRLIAELENKIKNAKPKDKPALQIKLNEARDFLGQTRQGVTDAGESFKTKTGDIDARTQYDMKNSDPVISMMKRWQNEMRDTRQIIATLGQTVQGELGTALGSAFSDVVNGTKTIGDAFRQMFANIGKAFMDMAAQMMSKWIVMKIMGLLSPGTSGGGGWLPNLFTPNTYGTGGLQFATGGIATGPTSGYSATLHGTEAVVPLSNNRSIPVEISGAGTGGGNVSSVVNITIASDGTPKTDRTNASQMGQVIEAAVMGIIQREKRTGGIL